MKRLSLLIPLIVILVGGTVYARTPAPSPDRDVPEQHWAYDAVRLLAQWGLWVNSPDSMYAGKRAFTRREFARFTAQLADATIVMSEAGWPQRPGYRWGRRPSWDPLNRLANEFRPEIILIGADTPRYRDELSRFATFWAYGRPQGIQTPLIRSYERYNPAERESGKRLADAEWSAGKVVLWTRLKPPSLHLDLSDAIPLQAAPTDPAQACAESSAEKAAGHNAEVWRLLRENVPPAGTRLAWTSRLFDLAGWWRRERANGLKLTRTFPGAVMTGLTAEEPKASLLWSVSLPDPRLFRTDETSDGRLRATWWKSPPEQRLTLRSSANEVTLALPGFPPPNGSMQLLWGPAGSGVALIRVRQKDDGEMPYRLYAFDLRTGMALNAEAVEE